MVRLNFSISLTYQVGDASSDFIFNLQAARTLNQRVVAEDLWTSQPVAVDYLLDNALANRYMRLRAGPGPLTVNYRAAVDIDHVFSAPQTLLEAPIAQLPMHVLPFIYPSRYCQSDRLRKLANREFGHLMPGYWRASAIQQWVQARTTFTSASTDSSTSAADTLIEQVGVCRDFAHLMIALCRAVNIPARFVSGIDYGADPALGPTDFHAYVEVYVGNRWYIFDPSGTAIPMGFIRIGTGRDAADISFATMFGNVQPMAPVLSIEAVADDNGVCIVPFHRTDAISTAGEFLS
jgi:transglutaminase-like putative cysteine protease